MDKFIFVSLLVLFIISLAESFFNDEYQALRIDREYLFNNCVTSQKEWKSMNKS